ncbi:MAG: asparaginase [Alphaproteobacteria bacterium]|nr:asparaginase [Alphaproteobacteria bacterium]
MAAAEFVNPVLVEVLRGTLVECRHRGAAAVAAPGGVAACWGDVARPVYARSAIKPLQALPLVETGAADRFRLDDSHLALACASHNGEPVHVEVARAWLSHLGLGPADLRCGTHAPIHAGAAAELVRAGSEPSPLHNNCSGKHCGFLSTAIHRGERIADYVAADHPAQRRWIETLSELAGESTDAAPRGIDGCGIPVVGTSLRGLALAMARLATGAGMTAKRATAAARLRAAMAARPELVAGTERFCSVVMRAIAPRALIKIGAEGVYCAALPERGLGIALKIDDGAERAAEVAMGALLRHFGAVPPEIEASLHSRFVPALRNRAGAVVGAVRPADGWPAS